MKTAVATFGVAIGFPLKLCKQALQRNLARGKNTQVAVHGQDVFVFGHGIGTTYRYSFLTPARKPFADFSLTQQNEHFFLDEARQGQLFVYLNEFFVTEVLSLVSDGGGCWH